MNQIASEESTRELKSFGRKLTEKRRAAGETRQSFAAKCGLSYKHYFNLESGSARPSLPAYISICKALGVTMPLIG